MNTRMADHVREALEQMIVTGEFADGERLDEIRLAERFHVSRTPLREAFQVLAASGLVELLPRRGAFVRHPAFHEMIEMFEVMAELEAFCGRLAARRVTPDVLAAIRATVDACEAAAHAGDSDGYYRENERFHHMIYTASGNEFLEGEAQRLHRRLQPFRRMQLRVRGRMVQSLTEHRQILDALEEGDSTTAETVLRDHVAVQGGKFNDLMASYKQSNLRAKPPLVAMRG
ncbi:MAG: GntR family transcriptional regulator [Paracoccaceae bacterium]|uniref:GntR family transcriptional regulator n=1 Tax=Seohaeicola saemankumensis TaxID=481181 RepID=UPI001E4706CE|nr:GntR family transcriptional regulator [Seohaeicola saemankumensis]MCD1625586.1 GntR family transcriptional regulator [Seohaeicola saemankumensis]